MQTTVLPSHHFPVVISLPMYLLHRINAMLDIICMGSLDLQGTKGTRKKKYKMKNSCQHKNKYKSKMGQDRVPEE